MSGVLLAFLTLGAFSVALIAGALDPTAGLPLTAIYLVMMVGSALIGRLADRIGPRWPVLGGLVVYSCGRFLLSRISTASSVPLVVAGILVMAVGMAILSAPLATVTMSARDEADQGEASAFNNTLGQLAGLLASCYSRLLPVSPAFISHDLRPAPRSVTWGSCVVLGDACSTANRAAFLRVVGAASPTFRTSSTASTLSFDRATPWVRHRSIERTCDGPQGLQDRDGGAGF